MAAGRGGAGRPAGPGPALPCPAPAPRAALQGQGTRGVTISSSRQRGQPCRGGERRPARPAPPTAVPHGRRRRQPGLAGVHWVRPSGRFSLQVARPRGVRGGAPGCWAAGRCVVRGQLAGHAIPAPHHVCPGPQPWAASRHPGRWYPEACCAPRLCSSGGAPGRGWRGGGAWARGHAGHAVARVHGVVCTWPRADGTSLVITHPACCTCMFSMLFTVLVCIPCAHDPRVCTWPCWGARVLTWAAHGACLGQPSWKFHPSISAK